MSSRPHPARPTNWWSEFKRQGYYFRPVALAVIAFGAYLHLTRLFVGDDILLARVVTPLLDQIFAIPMAYAGVTGLLSWRRIEFKNGWHKAFVSLIVLYIAASIPIHVATYFTGSTEFLRQFPLWFSALLLPYYAAVLVTLWHLRFKSA